MYKVLVVDDERMIRLGIQRAIPWGSLQVDEVFVAGSAGEALERYTERVTSRLLDKGACLRVGFVGGDVRRERRRKGKEA
mgnify:CR=1 FL=1